MSKRHEYTMTVRWTGNLGPGTTGYNSYSRDHIVLGDGKAPIAASSDPTFHGDPGRYNPEELLIAALSQCHLLWYLHLAASAGVIVTEYEDRPLGVMSETDDGSGQFVEVTLRPRVVVTSEGMVDTARKVHNQAHRMCYIANSVNFPVWHQPTIEVSQSV